MRLLRGRGRHVRPRAPSRPAASRSVSRTPSASEPNPRSRATYIHVPIRDVSLLQVFAKKDKRATYPVEIHGHGYTAALLRTLFAALERHQELHEELLVTFPVIREPEDPKLMAELDRRMADLKSGTCPNGYDGVGAGGAGAAIGAIGLATGRGLSVATMTRRRRRRLARHARREPDDARGHETGSSSSVYVEAPRFLPGVARTRAATHLRAYRSSRRILRSARNRQWSAD